MALSVPADRHRGLHGGQVVSDPAVHGGPLRAGVRPHGRRGLLLPAGGDRAGQTDQAADLGHGGPGTLQVRTAVEQLKWKNQTCLLKNNASEVSTSTGLACLMACIVSVKH